VSKFQSPFDQSEAALTALGNDVRRRIVRLVAANPCSTGQIAKHFPISRPAISKHLKMLTDAGLIERQTSGTQGLYQLQQSGFTSCTTWLNQFWPEALISLKAVAEDSYRPDADE
jgi:DNA-binding transcriptional ArsR family regulator